MLWAMAQRLILQIQQAAWFGLPTFHAPEFNANAMMIIAPIALILVAENLGHIKAVECDDW